MGHLIILHPKRNSNNLHDTMIGPLRDEKGLHTVNERISVESYLEMVGFYHELIRNYDES